jgi:hypothetical protein
MDYRKIPSDDLAHIAEVFNSTGWKLFKEIFDDEYKQPEQTYVNNTIIKSTDIAMEFAYHQGKLAGIEQVFKAMEQLRNKSLERSNG